MEQVPPQGAFDPVETRVASLRNGADGVIYIRFKATSSHGLVDAQEVVEAHNSLASGVPRPVLADLQNVTMGADGPARKHYSSEEGARYKTGMAMLVKSPLQRMFGNIFFLLNRPPYPSRMFSKEEDALQWLRSLQATSS